MNLSASAQREQALIELIHNSTDKGSISLCDLGLAWSYWDDNENECTDDNVAYTREIVSLSIETDCNGAEMIMVQFDDENEECWGNVDYVDDMGNNLGEYIYDEVISYY